jgi:hypothetical protein
MKGYREKRISPITKMQILVYDGNDHDGPEFAKEVVIC